MSNAAAAYRFTLFVAGKEPNSLLAEDNLRQICDEYLRHGVCTVKVVDVVKDFQAAVDHDILVTPTLIVEGPRGRAIIIGNLSAVDRILLTLGCS